MTLLTLDQVPEHLVERKFGHRPWMWLAFLAVWTPGPPAVSWFLWQEVKIAGWPVYAVAAVVVPLGFLFWALVAGTVWSVVVDCMRPANWVMKTTSLGVLLKFRSYMNAHFPDDGPTVVQLDWSEIAAARRYRWRTMTIDSDDNRVPRNHDYLELELRGVATEPLRVAIAGEMTRKPPKRWISSRANHAPVVVPRPGVVQAEWLRRAMLRAVEARVALAPAGDSGPASEEAPGSIPELARRGMKMQAIAEARRLHGMSIGEARDHVARLMEEDARAER